MQIFFLLTSYLNVNRLAAHNDRLVYSLVQKSWWLELLGEHILTVNVIVAEFQHILRALILVSLFGRNLLTAILKVFIGLIMNLLYLWLVQLAIRWLLGMQVSDCISRHLLLSSIFVTWLNHLLLVSISLTLLGGCDKLIVHFISKCIMEQIR